MVDIRQSPPREGTRGGLELFQWHQVKGESMRDRESYLGSSLKVGIAGRGGRFYKHDWWTRRRLAEDDKDLPGAAGLDGEMKVVKAYEDELMLEALGVKPKNLLLRKQQMTQEEMQKLVGERSTETPPDTKDASCESSHSLSGRRKSSRSSSRSSSSSYRRKRRRKHHRKKSEKHKKRRRNRSDSEASADASKRRSRSRSRTARVDRRKHVEGDSQAHGDEANWRVKTECYPDKKPEAESRRRGDDTNHPQVRRDVPDRKEASNYRNRNSERRRSSEKPRNMERARTSHVEMQEDGRSSERRRKGSEQGSVQKRRSVERNSRAVRGGEESCERRSCG